jgi:hypothetical protein
VIKMKEIEEKDKIIFQTIEDKEKIIDELLDNDFDRLIKKHLELKKLIDTLSSKDDVIKAEITMFMKQNNLNRVEDVFGNLVTYKEQTRESINKENFINVYGLEKFNELASKSTFSSLRITTKENKEKFNKK